MLRGLGFFILALCVISASFLLRKSRSHDEELSSPSTPPEINRQVTAASGKPEPEKASTVVHSEKEQKNTADKKMSILTEILATKNDNDPRLDTDFRKLNTIEKEALRSRYEKYKHEMFNERGTVIFLLGRNITTEKDMKFLNGVMLESPCLSMSNCSSAAKRDNDPEASHLGSVNSVTQAYPQIVTIKSLENFLGESSNPSLKALAIEGLLNASHSRSSTVADLAHSTLNRLNSRGF